MERVKHHHYIDTVDQVLSDAVDRGLFHLSTQDHKLSGRTVKLLEHDVVNFGSCSYLGLELDRRLIDGVIDAVQRFGTQYSSSRAYVSSGQYIELESTLSHLFDNPTIVTPSTTLGHIGAIPILVGDDDAVLLDHQVHASVQTAVNLLKPRGIPVIMIRHNNLDSLVDEYKKLKSKHRKIWYMLDGVYSMYGDFAPFKELNQLMEIHQQLHLYVDDAHGMSWTGKNGSGYALSQIQQHPNMVLAVSLNKAFACAGGAIILSNKELARKVRTCASSLVFSGPIQPPMLGAAIASAKLHLNGEIHSLQNELRNKILFANSEIKRLGLPLIAENTSPILFIAVGLPRITYALVKRMLDDGFYINAGIFPGTPMNKGGIRFTLTRHLKRQDITQMLEALAYHYPRVLEDEGSSLAKVRKLFKLNTTPLLTVASSNKKAPNDNRKLADFSPNVLGLSVTHETSIYHIEQVLWDKYLGDKGSFNWNGMAFQEKTFHANQLPEHHYRYHYFIVQDQQQKIVLLTFFSVALLKDDMFVPKEVSEKLEQQRKYDKYRFTSKAVMLGSMLSEGEHLYLNYQHPNWKSALDLLLDKMHKVQKSEKASSIILRDFEGEKNPQLKSYLLTQGLIEVNIPDNHKISNLEWNSTEEFLARLSSRARRHVRREMLDYSEQFDVLFDKNVTDSIKRCCYQLYKNVQTGNLAINCYGLPFNVIDSIFKSSDWDVIRLHLSSDTSGMQNEQPIAVMFAYRANSTYTPLLAGLNYDYLNSHKIYKQLLYQTVQRARALNMSQVNFGFTASQEKRQVGAKAIPNVVYVQTKDNFTAEYMETLATS